MNEAQVKKMIEDEKIKIMSQLLSVGTEVKLVYLKIQALAIKELIKEYEN